MAYDVAASGEVPDRVSHCTKFARNLTNELSGSANPLVVQELSRVIRRLQNFLAKSIAQCVKFLSP
jgi:hypothetical protein